jgi:hypothetical protein
MSDRDPNLSAAIYVSLVVGLMAICLVLILASPSHFVIHRTWAWLVLLALFFGIPILDRVAHRSRIKEAVRVAAGNVISITREPFWRQPAAAWQPRKLWMARQIKYRVVYEDLFGVRQDIFCLSGWFHGVQWLDTNGAEYPGGQQTTHS